MDDWRRQEGRRQARSRETNEWIEQATNSFGGDAPRATYVCECGDPDCGASISLAQPEYEAVRAHGARFVIAPDHEDPEGDRVVLETERYAVIEKLPGAGSHAAHDTDPRRDD